MLSFWYLKVVGMLVRCSETNLLCFINCVLSQLMGLEWFEIKFLKSVQLMVIIASVTCAA